MRGWITWLSGQPRGCLIAAAVAVVLVLVALYVTVYGAIGLFNSVTGFDMPNLPNPFDNGHDGDDGAIGSLRLEGQTALTATDSLVVKIGEGEATVVIKAKQNWDRSGNFSDGDFQSTNGTASVRDPDNTDQPAHITVGVDYCSEGRVVRAAGLNSDGEPGDPEEDEITFDMGDLFVCGVHWLPTAENEAAFHQDDTPDDFQGAFEELIKGAAVAAVAASECPDTLVESYTTDDYLDFVAGAVAEREGVPSDQVTVTPGTPGTTSAETQADLLQQLEGFVDTDDLDIDDFSGSGRAVEDSCFVDTRGEALDGINDVQVPDPRDQL